MGKFDKIYVLAPYNYATGGVELAHQLVDYLRRKNEKAFICYVDGYNTLVANANITASYCKYDIATCAEIEDKSENILILPEIYFGWIQKYTEIQLGCWWMSVDNYYKNCCIRDAIFFNSSWANIKQQIKLYICNRLYERDKNLGSISLLRKNENRIIHLYQSHYAQYHLYSLGFSKVLPLSDYINSDLNICDKNIAKQDIVLYNPAKGYVYTEKVIKRMPEVHFIPLKGLTREQLNNMFDKAKLYIDFGNFPGKDRLPREAVLHHCCVITGKKGAAHFYEDVPILEQYKFGIGSITAIVESIKHILSNYQEFDHDFDFYRHRIRQEEQIFYSEIEEIFLKNHD